jgi:ribonuclease BN (tRNA processing enzyme)
VNVTILPSAVAGSTLGQSQYFSSYLINESVAIDAGCVGFFGTPDVQARVKHIFLSHSHIDHVGSLPVFLENAYDGQDECVTVHGSQAVLDSLRKDVFNNRLWPDFINMSDRQKPFLKLAKLEPGRPVHVEGLRLTPIEVDHSVPTFGFAIEDGGSGIIISSDTGPTEALWQGANRLDNLKAVFLEATFPDSMAPLAAASRHLTPSLFAGEVRKLKRPARVIAVHIKARVRDRVVQELEALDVPGLEIGQFGTAYSF